MENLKDDLKIFSRNGLQIFVIQFQDFILTSKVKFDLGEQRSLYKENNQSTWMHFFKCFVFTYCYEGKVKIKRGVLFFCT